MTQSAPSLSPRRRRLRNTCVVLVLMMTLSASLVTVLYLKMRPTQYRPDERPADITSSLARNLPPDAPVAKFADVTGDAGLSAFRTFVGERTSQLPEDMGPGAAWGDFDNDGDDDVFLVSAGGAMNLPKEGLAACELQENLGDGSFRKVEEFPETRIHGMAAAWADYDGDGFLDFVVTGYDALLLFRNEGGSGKFRGDPRLPNLPGFWSGASWGDYDNDRRPDLYVCGYVQYNSTEADRERGSEQTGTFVPFTLNPASYPGGTNLLFHNNGDGTFTEVGAQLKVQNPQGRSLGALWQDFDDDGWLDLYVANDISDNVFFHNRGARFEDMSHSTLMADYRSAMGLAAGDYNRDGDDDLYITHWVAQENGLYDSLWADFNLRAGAKVLTNETGDAKVELRNHQRLVATATTNKYPLRFMDVADMKGLGQMSLAFVGWGAEFADFDGDGWLDLFVANGNTLEFAGPFPRKLKPQEPFLLWNQRGEHFFDLTPFCKPLARQHNSRGLAVCDYDDDGDVDVLLLNLGEGAKLLRNEMQTGHWLKVRLRSMNGNGQPVGFGDGAKVIAHLGDVQLRRTVSSVSYLSQSSRTLHFGLGNATKVEQLEVRWHAGRTNYFDHLEADATYEIIEGQAAAKKIDARRTGALTLDTQKQQSPVIVATDKERLLQFWSRQRAAMNAMKVEKDNAKAIELFREALKLNARHEDSRYYLGLCLASRGDAEGALAQLDELKRINSHSHRAWQQWGVLRASFAETDAELAAAESSLEHAHALNPEETGALLVLGEISLMRGDVIKANERLAAACITNPRAVGGFFLRGYLAWKGGDAAAARKRLEETRAALGKEWQPRGSTSEGDVKHKQHVESTPLTRFWEAWDGAVEPGRSFAKLEAYLKTREAACHAPRGQERAMTGLER